MSICITYSVSCSCSSTLFHLLFSHSFASGPFAFSKYYIFFCVESNWNFFFLYKICVCIMFNAARSSIRFVFLINSIFLSFIFFLFMYYGSFYFFAVAVAVTVAALLLVYSLCSLLCFGWCGLLHIVCTSSHLAFECYKWNNNNKINNYNGKKNATFLETK